MQVTPCPRCHAHVIIPSGTPDAAVVRCPLCTAEYVLAEALAQALPALIIVSLPEGAEPLAAPESPAADSIFAGAPVGEMSDLAAPHDHGGAAAEPMSGPMSLGKRPAPAKPKKQAGGLFQTAGVILGGLMAIPLAQLILWWLPGSLSRDFGLGPTVAQVPGLRWMVPQQFQGRVTKEEGDDEAAKANSAEHNGAATKAPPEKENGNAGKSPAAEKTARKGASSKEEAIDANLPHPDLSAALTPEPERDVAKNSAKPGPTPDGPTNDTKSEAPPTDRSPRGIATHWYLSTLADDDQKLASALRWWPAGGRPVLGLRWGVGVTIIGLNNPPSVSNDETLEKYTGGLGPKLRDPLVERMQSGVFGKWPSYANESLLRIPVSSNTRSALVEWARALGLDALLQIELEAKVTSAGGARDLLTKVRLIDVDGASSGHNVWFSSDRLLKEALLQQKNMQQYVSSVVSEVDAQFALQPSSAATSEQAQARLEKVEAQRGLPALRMLAEVRYYQTQKLVDAAAAEGAYDKLLGEGKGHAFAVGTGAERKALATGLILESK